MGVERALKKYLANGTAVSGQKCPHCGSRDPHLSGRLPDMHLLRQFEMRMNTPAGGLSPGYRSKSKVRLLKMIKL